MKEHQDRNKQIGSNIKEYLLMICGFAIGIFFIYWSGFFSGENEPITRDEAVAYVGEFDSYESSENYCGINFKDGSYYAVHAHTEQEAFMDAMNALDEGTRLSILINPNNDYVIEVKTDTQELLNFEASQKAIRSSENGYFFLGIGICAVGVLGTVLLLAMQIARSRQKQSRSHSSAVYEGFDTPALRYADMNVKYKTLLERQIGQYKICYRRVKSTNELVVNGCVYDEYKAVIEFEHALYAVVDGHHIEVGYDAESYSYIKFDGNVLSRKMRLV